MEFLRLAEAGPLCAKERLANSAKSAITANATIQYTRMTVLSFASCLAEPFVNAPSSTRAFYVAAIGRSSR
jgi:hypothetical protein